MTKIMKIFIGVSIVFFLLGAAFTNDSFAQSSDTETVMQEILVHKMVNGTFVIERQELEMTRTTMSSGLAVGSSPPEPIPWHIQNGYDSKILPLLQKEIEHNQYNCTPEEGFPDTCPPMRQNSDGEYIVKISIGMLYPPVWPNGFPDPNKLPTKDQINERFSERKQEIVLLQQPMIDLLTSNNYTAIQSNLYINTIHADVSVDFLSQIIEKDYVQYVDSRNGLGTLEIRESKQITGVAQTILQAYDGSNIKVAIMDTGLDIVGGSYDSREFTATPTHDDFQTLQNSITTKKLNKIVDHVGNNPDDCSGHGTNVAGVLAGIGSVDSAYSGYAPDAQLNIYKVTNDCTDMINMVALVDAITNAIADGVDVINLSMNLSRSADLTRMINAAHNAQIAIVTAAGNDNGRISGVADASNVITIGASSQEEPNLRMFYSNYGISSSAGIKPDLVAPVDTNTSPRGGMITTALGTHSYRTVTGTSFAAPQVSGAIADLMTKYDRMRESIDIGRVYAILLSQATGSGTSSNGLRMDSQVGAGTLNLRYDTLETHSTFIGFSRSSSSDSFGTMAINVPDNAERLTVAAWWPNDTNFFRFELELLQNGAIVESSKYTGGSVQRLIVDNPVTGDGAYSLKTIYRESGSRPDSERGSERVYISITFTLPNHLPSVNLVDDIIQTTNPLTLKILGTDTNHDTLSFYVSNRPTKGTITPESGPNNYLPHLTRASTNLTYTAHPDVTGTDSFRVAVWDGKDTVISDPINIVLTNPDPTPPPRPDPTELPNIIVSDIVVPPNNGKIFLDASQTTGTGDISFSWQQLGNGAPLVRLLNTNTAIASFVPPFVSRDQTRELLFLIEATDDIGTSSKLVRLTLDLITPPPVIPPPIVINPDETRTAILSDQFRNFGNWHEHSKWDIERPEHVLPVEIDTNGKVAHIEECPDPPCVMDLREPLIVRPYDRLEMSFWMWFGDEIRNSDRVELETAMVQYYSQHRQWQDLEMIKVGSQDFETWFKTTIDISDLITLKDIVIRLVPMIQGDDSIIQIDAFQIDGITIDNTPPVFNPISNVNSATYSTGGIIVDYPLPTARDAMSGSTDVFCNPQSGIVFPIGSTRITCTSSDSAGNTATASFNVIVTLLKDTVPPTITVPADITSEVTCPGTSVNLGQATAIDNTDPNPTITSDAPAQFPPGTTIVTWTATDDSGNIATDTQTVTIRDTVNPVLAPIINLVSESVSVTDYANLAPSVTDNSCDVIIPTNDAPDSFPLGDTLVTWTATDSAGNSASTSHTVTIQDSAPPIVMAPLDVTSEVTCPGTTVSLGTVAVSDNYDPSPQITNDAPDSFPLGTTTVTWTATDGSGNMATDEQLVTIRDTTPPSISPIINLVSESVSVTDYANLAPSVTDNSCDVIIPTNDAPDSFPVGDTIVTWTATDTAGNSASITHTVTILDTASPIITAPLDVISEVTCPGTTVSLGTAAVSDNYDPNPQITNDAPDSFPLGTTTVIWTATDTSGNSATDTQTVTVRDTTPPNISPINNLVSEPITVSDYANLAPSVTDNSCDVIILTHNAPNSFPLGDTIVTWTARDTAGNSASTSHTVTIQDSAPPIVMAPLDVTSEVTCPGTTVSLGTAAVSDNYDPNPRITNDAPDSFPLGTTTVIWTATDTSGNSATDVQLVTIRDTTPPNISPINNLVSEPITVSDYANLAPSVTDNSCDVIAPTHNAPNFFPVGDTLVTWTATDSVGNSASTSHTVTIQDRIPPIVMAPLDVTSEVTCPGTTVSLGTAAVSDNYDPNPRITNDAPHFFPLGTTTVTWTATDASGNSATDTQTVTVRDTTNPVFLSIDDLVSESITVSDYANLAPSVTDNSCDVIILTHNAPNSFPLGDTIVTWTARDTAGNSASITHTVTIQDRADPIIMAPLDVTSEVTCPGTTVSLGTAAVSDNYDPNPRITNDAPDSFPLGTTTVIWTATDTSGNSATDVQLVTIRDTTPPNISPINNLVSEPITVSDYANLAPSVTDNSCDVIAPTHNAPNFFPVGDTLVTWTATDSVGNSASTSHTVTIQDRIPPIVMAPLDVTSEVTCPGTTVSLGTAAVSDNYDPNPQITHDAPDSFLLGTTTVTWTATDAFGNTATDVQLVTIRDTAPPVFSKSYSNAVYTHEQLRNIPPVAPIATDNSCDVITPTHDAPDSFPEGTTIVTWTATDSTGNKSTINQRIILNITEQPYQPPIMSTPSDIRVSATSSAGAIVHYGTPTTRDYMGNLLTVTCTPDSGTVFPTGLTIGTCSATDSRGNTVAKPLHVTVIEYDATLITEYRPGYITLSGHSAFDGQPTLNEEFSYTINIVNHGSEDPNVSPVGEISRVLFFHPVSYQLISVDGARLDASSDVTLDGQTYTNYTLNFNKPLPGQTVPIEFVLVPKTTDSIELITDIHSIRNYTSSNSEKIRDSFSAVP